MATADERALALAVARGQLEPDEVRGASLEGLVAAGRLTDGERRLLEQDLADLEADEIDHWSMEVTAEVTALTLLRPEAEPTHAGAEPTHAGAEPTRIGPELAHAGAAPTQVDAPPPSPSASPAPSDPPSGPARGFRQGGVFRAQALDRWGRFENLVLLGEGGMGRIFRATDPRLRREVALKLLRREDPELIQRFLQEAQLQARVDHPNVCRVYEVGEWRGQPYIAMQFLRGETLQKAAPHLPLEALLRHMVEVCEGVHAAHRVGLVHRDLKPPNLMIDHPDGEPPRASVLDFGLARGAEGRGLTETGRVMGTVSYMAPEQVRGETARLDRRSDVYSLGATLYTLLAGSPPFGGEGLACMERIVKDEPPPLRRKVPTAPADLETIVLTCLQKDPRRRYATARALGEDLQRLLDGEPIQARPATRAEKLARWVKTRKTLVAASAAVLLSMAVFGGMALRERLRAQARATYAQRFAQAAERIEALARYLKLSPPHDLGPERRDLEARVARLAEEVKAESAIAEAPGEYAIGRARLALGQPEQAQTHLERARALGFDTPELRSALGRALLELHQHALDEAWRIGQGDARKEAVARLQARAATRIEPLLTSGAPASLIPLAYLQGQAAWVSGRWEEAVAKAKEAQAQAPWFYEARLLEARALLSWGLPMSGPERTGILADAHKSAQAALLAAPCDVEVLQWVGRITVIRQGLLTTEGPEANTLRIAAENLVVDLRVLEPDGAKAAILEADFLTTEAERANVQGKPTSKPLRLVFDLLKPLAGSPTPPFEVHVGLMRAECCAAKVPDLGDPINWLDQALVHGRLALNQRPGDTSLARELARTSIWRMAEGNSRGEAPWAVFEEALMVLRRALEREPEARSLYEGLGFLWGERAEYERLHDLDPRPSLVQSMQGFQKVLSQGPSFASYYGLANAALMAGQWEVDHHQPGALNSLKQAEEAYLQARSLAPHHFALASNMVEVALWKGKAMGGPTTEQGAKALMQAEAHFHAEVGRFPEVAVLWLRGGEVAQARGFLDEARRRFRRAFALNPHLPAIRTALGSLP